MYHLKYQVKLLITLPFEGKTKSVMDSSLRIVEYESWLTNNNIYIYEYITDSSSQLLVC